MRSIPFHHIECLRENAEDERVRQALIYAVGFVHGAGEANGYGADDADDILRLVDHKGQLTVYTNGRAAPEIQNALRRAWEQSGEPRESVTFVNVWDEVKHG